MKFSKDIKVRQKQIVDFFNIQKHDKHDLQNTYFHTSTNIFIVISILLTTCLQPNYKPRVNPFYFFFHDICCIPPWCSRLSSDAFDHLVHLNHQRMYSSRERNVTRRDHLWFRSAGDWDVLAGGYRVIIYDKKRDNGHYEHHNSLYGGSTTNLITRRFWHALNSNWFLRRSERSKKIFAILDVSRTKINVVLWWSLDGMFFLGWCKGSILSALFQFKKGRILECFRKNGGEWIPSYES